MLFPWRPVENFLVPHAACPRAVMCQSFRKRACLIFGTRTIRDKERSMKIAGSTIRKKTSKSTRHSQHLANSSGLKR